MNSNKHQNENMNQMADRLFEMVETLLKVLWMVSKQLFLGVTNGTMPFINLAIATLGIFAMLTWNIDQHLWLLLDMGDWYPQKTYQFYFYTLLSSPFWGWGLFMVVAGRQLENKTDYAFASAGMKDPAGKTPKPIYDKDIGGGVRKLSVKRGAFPKANFEKARSHLESGMGMYIDEIKENRSKKTVDITYSRTPMPSRVYFNCYAPKELGFMVGKTKSKAVYGNLGETPHLLVAGQTGGGKSTFIRGLITGLYKNNRDIDFTLIDLKGGLEFQVFENLKRVRVIPSIDRAIKEFKGLAIEVEKRMKLLKETGVKDLDGLQRRKEGQDLTRKVVVVDEAAEIFLGGHHASAAELTIARKVISQIARQGRAVGVHLVIATQRPDSKAIDPQVKTNLTGIICFQMPNNISSMTVLDTGRATLLPDIPGRAIWKSGGAMTEVQTPNLEIDQTNEFLEKHRTKRQDEDLEKEKPSLDSLDWEDEE